MFVHVGCLHFCFILFLWREKVFLTFVFTFEFTVVVDSNYQMVKNFGDGICSQSGEHGVSLVGTFFEISPPINSNVYYLLIICKYDTILTVLIN